MNCIFCNIVNDDRSKSEIIYEDDDTLAFLDINPLNYGHSLVIPKKHFKDFLDLPEDVLAKITLKVKYIADILKNTLKADGINIVVNNGEAANQSVFHFHYHIIPRFNSDIVKWKPEVKKYTNEDFKLYGLKLRTALNK